jgi:septal ring factor EnvC (AmiA/AmiB activator)
MLAVALHPAAAQDKSGEELKKVERTLTLNRATRAQLSQKQQELAKAIAALRQRSVELARALQIREADILRLEKELEPLQARERAETVLHKARQAEFARILAVLERLRLNPPILLAARPGAPNDAVRGAIVLKSMAGKLHERAAMIEAQLTETRQLREQIETRYERLKKQVAALDKARSEISDVAAAQAELLKSTEDERRAAAERIAALSRQARTLRELVGRIDATPGGRADDDDAGDGRTAALTQPNALKQFATSKGLVSLPAAGRIVQKFGEDGSYGQSSKGIVIAARPGAQVVAPFDGQVVFAGPFRGYGLILIIKHTDGYHSLVAGLARIDAVAKQWVLAGEPVGIVGEFQAAGPRLYLEIRHRGHPINPLPWLAADKRKVNG